MIKMSDNPWHCEPSFHEGKGRVNLRDIIGLGSGYGDLDKLYSVPFKIDAENDFPLMYMLAHKIHQDRRDIAKGLNLSEKEWGVVGYALGYDYKPEDKIISSYVYHQMRDDGVSEKFLDDFKTFKKSYCLLFHTGVGEASEGFPRDAVNKIWQEYGNLGELKGAADLSFERMENSGELKNAYVISRNAKDQIIKIGRFSSRDGCVPNPCLKSWKKYIELSGLHKFSCVLGSGL